LEAAQRPQDQTGQSARPSRLVELLPVIPLQHHLRSSPFRVAMDQQFVSNMG
jgi:hypothetical protein